MTIYVGDLEANSLDPDKVWCVIFKEFLIPRGRVYINDDFFDNTLDISLPAGFERFKLSALKQFLGNPVPGDRLVFHNGIDYDFYVFDKLFGVRPEDRGWEVRDTLILSRVTDVRRPGGHSVEAWGKRFGINKVEIEPQAWAKFDPVMISRCLTDVTIQEKIYEHLRKVELRGFSSESIDLEQRVQGLISRQRRDGVFLDLAKVNSLYSNTKRLADVIEVQIQKVFPPQCNFIREYNPKVLKDGTLSQRPLGGCVASGPFSSISFDDFNLDSPAQRVDRLLALGWKPTRFTKPSETYPEGQPKFDEDTIDELPEDVPKEIKLLGEYLMLRSKQRTANQWLDAVDAKGYIHGSVNTLGARTHRMSHTGPNLGNIAAIDYDKETKEVLRGIRGRFGWESRSCFAVEKPQTHCYVDADADGIQLRAVAHYADDLDYIRIISDPKYDPHQTHADVLSCTRAKAKTFIYAWILGAGINKIASILGINVSDAKDRMDGFYQKFPFLLELKERALTAGEKGYMIALDGRPIRITEGYKALAYFLQSFERIIMARAMVDYHKKLNSEGMWFKQRLIVHDEFLTESRKENADYVGKAMSQAIVKAGEYYNSKCPLASKYLIGPSWASVH